MKLLLFIFLLFTTIVRSEEEYLDADVEMNAAFKVNMDAFKNKLRQIGFYTDMSDACILQKIRPRYKLDE